MKKVLIVSTICLSLIIGGCSKNTSPLVTTNKTVTKVTPTTNTKMTSTTKTETIAKPSTVATSSTKDITLEELKKYNGQNGEPAYVAISGVVYDVTNASGWTNGKHEGGVTAGNDLTKEMASAHSGSSVLKGLPVICKLK